MKKAGIYVNDLYCGVLTEDEEGISHQASQVCRADKSYPTRTTVIVLGSIAPGDNRSTVEEEQLELLLIVQVVRVAQSEEKEDCQAKNERAQGT